MDSAFMHSQRSWRRVRVGMVAFGLLAVAIGLSDPDTSGGHNPSGVLQDDSQIISADPVASSGPSVNPPLERGG